MLTATDTVCPEWLDTPEPLPPSWPGAPRDLARGALMPSQDISLTDMLPSSQSPTPPTATDLLDTPSARISRLRICSLRPSLLLHPRLRTFWIHHRPGSPRSCLLLPVSDQAALR